MRKFFTWKTQLAVFGRVSFLFEPRDLWIGWFQGETAGYACLIPAFVVRIAWKTSARPVGGSRRIS
jgi:hypothetical protein